MTSLALQLKRASAAQTEVFVDRNSRSSILYEAEYAKTITKDDFYKIGFSGFKELLKVNSVFERFEESLFGSKTVDLQRGICDSTFNAELDKNIEEFLFLLSPYLEKQASLQALEWLIYRFGVSSYSKNVDSLLMCALPYYESVLFVRVLQIVDLRKKNKLWEWLLKAQKGGIPLSKQVVYSHWAADKGFRNFIQKKIRKMILLHENKQNVNMAISFLITTQMGGLNTVAHVGERHLFSISTSIQWCLLSDISELVAGTYFMIMHMCLKIKMSQVLIDAILTAMFKNFLPELSEQFGLCLLTICNHQNITQFSDKIIPLISETLLLEYVSSVAREKCVASFLAPYVYGKIKFIFSNQNANPEVRMADLNSLKKYILEMNIAPVEAALVIRSFITSLNDYMKSDNGAPVICDMVELVQSFESCHPEATDRAAIKLSVEKLDKKVLDYFNDRHIDLLHIEDPFALKELLKAMMDESVSNHPLTEENFHLKGMKLMKKSLEKGKGDSRWKEVRHEVVKLIVTRKTTKLTPDDKLNILMMLLKNLSIAEDEKDIEEFKFVLDSKFAKSHPLLCSMREIFPKCEKAGKNKTDEIVSLFWQHLPTALSTLDSQTNQNILSKIEKVISSNVDCDERILGLRFIQSFMTMEGESFLRFRVSNSLLDATSAILHDSKVKITENGEGEKSQVGGSIPMTILRNTYSCILTYIDGVLDGKNVKSKSYLKISVGKKDDFNSGLRMLITIVKDILMMERRNLKCGTAIIQDIFNSVLKTPMNAFHFLSMIWSWHPELHSEGITIPMKLWALSFATSLLKTNVPIGTVKSLLGYEESFVSSLFLPLCEGDDDLRKATFKLLKTLVKLSNDQKCAENNLIPVVKCIMKFKNEILDDFDYLPTAFSSLKDEQMDTVQKLLKLVTEELVPTHTASTILYMLSRLDDISMMKDLVPLGHLLLNRIKELAANADLDPIASLNLYYILTRFASSGTMFQMGEGWGFFERCINYPKEVMKVTGKKFSPRDLVVNFNVLKDMDFKNDRELELFDILLTKAVQSQTTYDALKLRKELKKVSISASKLIVLLNKFNLAPSITSVRQARAKKAATISLAKSVSPSADSIIALNWQKLSLLVELIGVMNKVDQPWLLIGPLCNSLNHSFQLDIAVSDVIQQKILSLLLHILQMSVDSLKGDFSKMVQFDVVIIVRCIRTSANPDIHRRALLILSLATPYFPSQVLHSIMAIFTFMGNSLVRRDDAYSFQVIHLTISSIIPALIKSDGSNSVNLLKKLAEVTQVFVDALPDIANHRRLPLFTQLAKTMGVTEYLWLVMVLIADSYIMKPTRDGHAPGTLPASIHFALLLYSQFSVVEQLEATCEVANFLFKLPQEKNTSWMKNLTSKESSYMRIINMDIHSSKQLKHLKYTCLGLIVRLLTSELFVEQVYDVTSENVGGVEIDKLKNLYKNLLEKGLSEIKTISIEEENGKYHITSHFEASLKKKLVSFVDAINSLLPPNLLIDVVKSLLLSDIALLRCRAMEILSQKLQADMKFFDETHYKSVIGFTSYLNKASVNSADPEENQQIALYTLQLLVRMMGHSMNRKVLEGIVDYQCKLIVRKNISHPLRAQGILVIGETIGILKASILPYLKLVLPLLISLLVKRENDHLLLAGTTSLQKLVEFVPQFLHKYIPEIITSSCAILAEIKKENIDKENASVENRIHSKLIGIHLRITEKIEPRIAVPSFCSAYQDMTKSKQISSLPALLQLIESFIGGIKSEQLLKYKNQLINLFMETLDVREVHVEPMEIEVMEDSVISAFSRFLLKLNEDDNLRIYINLITWARMEKYPNRLITFFKFSEKLASVLKVLFIKTKLADKLLPYAVEVLENRVAGTDSDVLFRNKNDAGAKVDELLKYIFGSMTKVFTYDSVQFMNEDRFNLVLEPLIGQIENSVGGTDCFASRVREHLRPCIVSFTKSLTDDSLWKKLNKCILIKLRNDDEPEVTLACLDVFEGLVEGLGEDYLQPLLGDTMPYITEVVESLDTDVQNRTRELFSKMEAILGDDLRAYLN